jgi:putative addiction module component (TIGR02574 family)
MDQTTAALLQAVLALPPQHRAALAEQLLDSLADEEPVSIDAAWVEEAERRLRTFDEGKIKALPGDEVMRSLSIRKKS